MRRDMRRAPRAGFTLIELLVVIAILALLAALVAAGIGRVRDTTQGNVTNQSLTKLQKALENQWKATCDQARDDRRSWNGPTRLPREFGDLVIICDGDQERAEAMWMFMHLRRTMPDQFSETRSGDITVSGNGKSVSLKQSATFKEIQTSTATGNRDLESAAMLYLTLSQGGRGLNFSVDDAMQGAQTSVTVGTLTLPAFKDGFGRPIAFRRFHQEPGGEFDRPPYVRAGLAFFDPLDPVGRLKLWKTPNTNTPSPTKALAEVQVGTTFNGSNRIATAFSYGVDPDPAATNDDAYGYRLLRQGAKGD